MKLSALLAALQIDQRFPSDPEISGISTLQEASASQLSYATSHRHLNALRTTGAAAVLVPKQLREALGKNSLAIVVDNPELAMAKASRLFKAAVELPEVDSRQIDPTAVIFPNVALGSNVTVGRNARIMPGAYLGDGVVVGEETIIHPNCVIYHGCRIGNRCIIHANTVIGSDGFGYAHTKDGQHVKIEQLGNVIIEDDVEIGSNTSIDRATFTSTVIRQGTKIDNLVHISHNVDVGEHSLIAGQTGIAGSTTLGRNVVLAAQSGVTGHIRVADFTTVAARGGVSKDTEAGKTYAGFPMMEHKAWLRFQARLARLVKSSGG